MSYCKPFERRLYDLGIVWRSQNFGDNATIYGPHSGNDDAAPIGTPVHAAGDGYIEWAGEFDDTYLDNLLWLLKMGGNIAVLNCGANAPSFVYGHMHSFTVKRGDWVRKGQVIGYSGNTGTATTGAHLLTEAIPPGYALNSPMLGRVNPDTYLTEWPEDLNTGSLSYASETITPPEDDVSAEDVFTKKLTLKNGAESTFENQVLNISDDLSKVLKRLEEDRDYAQEVNGKIDALFNLLTSLPAEIMDKPITTTDGKETTLATELKWLPANFAAAQDVK